MEKNMYTLQLNVIVTAPLSISFHLLIRLCHLQRCNSLFDANSSSEAEKKKKKTGTHLEAFTIFNTIVTFIRAIKF